ncbi:MAG: glycosyltransferase family 4 protein [Gammaproteobacteria bacterium]|nr:MAG: glycosyltransferase family 4 protein [Gammaproteobacteria bacterium]
MAHYKLAFLINCYFGYGGMQRDMCRIAEACLGRGHDVHVFATDWQGEKPQGMQLHLLQSRAWTNMGRDQALAYAAQQSMAAEHFDSVIGFIKVAGLDIYYAADPCYAAHVDATRNIFYKLGYRYWRRRRQESLIFDKGLKTHILLIAHQEQQKFCHYYGTEHQRFHLLPPGIDKTRLTENIPDTQASQQLRTQLGVAQAGFMILSVGSHFGTKGVDRSIRALASLPEALRVVSTLVIVGSGKDRPYHELAGRLGVGDRVVFTGPRDDVADFYYAADMLLHPAYTENTGTTLLEAMVCGLPVLVTANCGYATHVSRADAGLVCPLPFEQGILNEQLATMLISDERAQWREHGLCYSREQDLYGMVDTAVAVIETITAAKQGEA